MSVVGVVLFAAAATLTVVLVSLAALVGRLARSRHDPVPIDSI